jgi:hypothetical protein
MTMGWEERVNASLHVHNTHVPAATAQLNQVETTNPAANMPILWDFARLQELRRERLQSVAAGEQRAPLPEATAVGSLPNTGPSFSSLLTMTPAQTQAVSEEAIHTIEGLRQSRRNAQSPQGFAMSAAGLRQLVCSQKQTCR